MKAKVAHLIKKLEEIERDGVELRKLTDRIAEDREYSPILKESFQSEMQKLEDQKAEILRVSVNQINAGIIPIKPERPSGEILKSSSSDDSLALDKKKTDKPIRKY